MFSIHTAFNMLPPVCYRTSKQHNNGHMITCMHWLRFAVYSSFRFQAPLEEDYSFVFKPHQSCQMAWLNYHCLFASFCFKALTAVCMLVSYSTSCHELAACALLPPVSCNNGDHRFLGPRVPTSEDKSLRSVNVRWRPIQGAAQAHHTVNHVG